MFKIGFRKPSLKKSLSARTKGRVTRTFKKAIIPNYGTKGMGWVNPKKKLYNKIYNKTTVGTPSFIAKLFFKIKKGNKKPNKSTAIIQEHLKSNNDDIRDNNVKNISSYFLQKYNTSLAHCGRVFREICGWSIWLSVLFSLVNAGVFFLFLWIILWLVTWLGIIDKK